MTVDMLAAAFWPEAALLGSRHPHQEDEAESAAEPAGAAAQEPATDGFWSTVMRHLWRTPTPPVAAR